MSAPPSRRVTLVVGVLVAVAGTVIFLAAANIIPQPDDKFGAPRWMVALFGLAFFFAGAVFTTWLAWTGGNDGQMTVSIGPFSMLLPKNVARSIGHVVLWFFAALNDALALFMWFHALLGLPRRRAP